MGEGNEVGVDGLEKVFIELAGAGCHNWNLVTPGPWLPFIREAAQRTEARGVRLPFVYNSSGYERVEVAQEYRGLMDIVLTDLRYSKSETAAEASFAPDYPVRAREFVKWSCEEVGSLATDGDGIATRGVIVRVLVLPGRAHEAVENLEWMARNVGTDVAVSLMSQYTPVHRALETPGWDKTVGEDEYEWVVERLDDLGFETGWVQEFGANSAEDDLLGCNMPRSGGVAKAVG